MHTQSDYDERLREHWERFSRRYYLPKVEGDHTLTEIIQRHSEPHRRYHGLKHPVLLLDTLVDARHRCATWMLQEEEWFAVELSILLHGIFYNGRVLDNEEKSARYGEQNALYLGFPAEVGVLVHDIIMATKHPSSPRDLPSQIMVDVDLSLLAVSWPDFVENSNDIRHEYGHVTEKDWRLGRRSFLQSMLERPRLYFTDYFHEFLEESARENLQRSLDEQFAV